jgi:hypothetical protein
VKKERLAFVLALTLVGGCRGDDQRTDTVDPEAATRSREALPTDLTAQLDSANQAFRAGRYVEALAHYTGATEVDPEVAAPWFGIFMVQRALGNEEAASAALDRARHAVPGATLLHPAAADSLP